jgi:type 1 glutamine amidotransferase
MWTFLRIGLLAIAVFLLSATGHAADKHGAKLRVALLTGGHTFEEKLFLEVFDGFKGMKVTHIALEKENGFLESDAAKEYDVFVLYNMSATIPESQRKSFIDSLDRGAGFVVMHHAIANYPDWPAYPEIIGAKYFLSPMDWQGSSRQQSEYTHDIDMPIHVEDPSSPITKGLSDFTIHDEVYRKWMLYPESHLLLSTTHELSDKAIAWTRLHGKAKLCFIQLGHGHEAYANPSFQEITKRAILWSCGRLPDEKPKQ